MKLIFTAITLLLLTMQVFFSCLSTEAKIDVDKYFDIIYTGNDVIITIKGSSKIEYWTDIIRGNIPQSLPGTDAGSGTPGEVIKKNFQQDIDNIPKPPRG